MTKETNTTAEIGEAIDKAIARMNLAPRTGNSSECRVGIPFIIAGPTHWCPMHTTVMPLRLRRASDGWEILDRERQIEFIAAKLRPLRRAWLN